MTDNNHFFYNTLNFSLWNCLVTVTAATVTTVRTGVATLIRVSTIFSMLTHCLLRLFFLESIVYNKKQTHICSSNNFGIICTNICEVTAQTFEQIFVKYLQSISTNICYTKYTHKYQSLSLIKTSIKLLRKIRIDHHVCH